MNKKDLKKISETVWEISKDQAPFMRVPARVIASDRLLEDMFRDKSLEQLMNTASLPGIQKAAMVMPDGHEGYGFPIGGVAATEFPDGVISPSSVGYDINCGVRLLKTEQTFEDVKDHLKSLARELFHQIPSGVGRGGILKLNKKEMDQVLKLGAKWMVKSRYGEKEDLEYLESNGCLENADPKQVSDHAKTRGLDQLGTLGAGNHFVEVDYVDQIFDEKAAKAFGLFKNQVVVLIHTGSRGLGHQIATDYIREMVKAMPKYGISVPDRQLACVPFSSPEGKSYFNAMCAGANFAWANRQLITWEVRRAWEIEFGKETGFLSILYDVAHNIAKVEEHDIDGKIKKVIVHRKGATRAFGPHHPEVPSAYKDVGQPVLIPGSMGTASYVLAGTKGGMKESFGSTCHGAGRRMSRKQALKEVQGHKLREELEKQGIHIQAGSARGLAEEAPIAYKDVNDVVNVVHDTGIAKKVARLRPIVVVKG